MTTMADRFQEGPFRGHRVLSGDSLWAGAGRIATALSVWLDRSRERHALLGLGDLQLRDIGISRAEAEGEGDKPFWRA